MWLMEFESKLVPINLCKRVCSNCVNTAQPETTSAFCWVLCLSIVGTLELRASGLEVDSDIDRFVTKQDTWNQTVGIVWCRTVLKCPSFDEGLSGMSLSMFLSVGAGSRDGMSEMRWGCSGADISKVCDLC